MQEEHERAVAELKAQLQPLQVTGAAISGAAMISPTQDHEAAAAQAAAASRDKDTEVEAARAELEQQARRHKEELAAVRQRARQLVADKDEEVGRLKQQQVILLQLLDAPLQRYLIP